MEYKLDFSNVLIKPRETELTSRKQVNLETVMSFKYSPLTIKSIPIMASNMDTVGTINIFKSLSKEGLMTCFHKFITLEEYLENKELLESNQDLFAISIGFSEK